MFDDFRSTYVLQYTPTGVVPGGWHDVGISIKKRGNFDLRAWNG